MVPFYIQSRNIFPHNITFIDSNELIVCNEKNIEKIGTQFYKCAVNSTKFNNINRLKRNYELNVVVKLILNPHNS